MMDFTGISRAQLLKELREEANVLAACVAKCIASVRAHFEAELKAVCAFIEYLTATPTNAPKNAKESQARCSFHKAIRRTFAIARDRGLNVQDETGMRAAFARAIGRNIASRDEMTGNDWQAVGDLIKCGKLAW